MALDPDDRLDHGRRGGRLADLLPGRLPRRSGLADRLESEVLITNYCLKVGWEVLATPLTYGVVGFLKRAEDEDYYDIGTDFTPFSLKT